MSSATLSTRPRVVVVGGGIAGLSGALAVARAHEVRYRARRPPTSSPASVPRESS